MTISALSIAKGPAPHCEKPAPSNLVKALASTRLKSSITHDFPVYTTSQSRSQRRINVERDTNFWRDRVMSGEARTKADKGFPLDLPPLPESVVRPIKPIGYRLWLVLLRISYDRCFRVSSDGLSVYCTPTLGAIGRIWIVSPWWLGPEHRQPFTANSSQVDRSQLCMPRGFKPATHGVFRPGRTGLRKTPSGWLSANRLEKAILVPCAWTIDNTGKPPFLVGVYDLVLSENNTTGA